MFDFLRDRGSTAGDERREALGAYLDGASTAVERERMEAQLARDANLRAELEQMRALKAQMRAMPRRRVPRSFALDPVLYGRPKAQPMMQLYPVLRGATALTAVLLIFTLALGAFRGQFTGNPAAAEISMNQTAAEEAAPVGAVEEAAPMIAPSPAGAEDRILPTPVPETGAAAAPAELTAQEVITEEFAVGALPPVEGEPAVTGVPEADLAIETTAPVVEATGPAATLVTATAVASAEMPVDETANTQIAGDETVKAGDGETIPTFLPSIQIGLGIALLLFLALWLIARRRARSF